MKEGPTLRDFLNGLLDARLSTYALVLAGLAGAFVFLLGVKFVFGWTWGSTLIRVGGAIGACCLILVIVVMYLGEKARREGY